MKKLFSTILVLGLLLNSPVYSYYPVNFVSKDLIIIQSGKGKYKALLSSTSSKNDKMRSLYNDLITQATRYCRSQGKDFFRFKDDFKKKFGAYNQRFICAENFVAIKELIESGAYDYKDKGWYFNEQVYFNGLDSTSAKQGTYPTRSDNVSKWYNDNKSKFAKKPKKQEQSIEFNIKQKKEQCEAIGFEPKTEKFADCVLRLVELDVKSQQDNQIVSAENSGNEALVEELRKQRNLQSSRYLLDLGKQLRQPKQYNSNIYMPQTQSCTIMGFGTFAKMNCR